MSVQVFPHERHPHEEAEADQHDPDAGFENLAQLSGMTSLKLSTAMLASRIISAWPNPQQAPMAQERKAGALAGDCGNGGEVVHVQRVPGSQEQAMRKN